MPATSLTGSDTAQINATILQTLADGNVFDVEFPNELAAVKAGKNGNTIYAQNAMGRIADVTLRVLLGGIDDKQLNSLMTLWKSDPSTFNLMTGVFVKHVGDGAGNIQSNVYQCSGGVFLKQPAIMSSSEGNTDQSVKVYIIRFGNCDISNQ